uniref:Uncharacterized protein n=1 Tax=viral metagenome TaxID=1070528 RepID=A0A6M3LR42_9ZZZZ
MEKRKFEEYLGDGLYADFDGYQIILSANDRVGGDNSTDRVALEPGVVTSFLQYIARLRKEGIPI